MKKISSLLTIAIVFGFTLSANAALVDNFDGTISDTGTGLMWLKDANLAGAKFTLPSTGSWYSSLTVGGYTDWRLPTAESGCTGFGCSGEMANLYYNEGITYASPGPFINLQSTKYWTTTYYSSMDGGSYITFRFDTGQSWGYNAYFSNQNVWAVREGVSAVPIPGALWLLGSCLIGLVGLKRRSMKG